MLERDLQNYLFQHPEVLFPERVIQEKKREFYIQGKRIDLLFQVDGTRYIVELKRHTVEREHLGQIVEYYGLLRGMLREEQIRMILVAPKIPQFRRVYLEEIGIRCVEVSVPLESMEASSKLITQSRTFQKQDQVRKSMDALFPDNAPITYAELSSPATPLSLAMTHRMLQDTLESVRAEFKEFETVPIRMLQAISPDMIAQPSPANINQKPTFQRGGAWWAYAFGESESMPKNDVPNISIASMPGSLDLIVNSELQTSQKVLIRKIESSPSVFDRHVKNHGGIEFQAWLKLEHQPRFYHWIPLYKEAPGSWDAEKILKLYKNLELNFANLRETYLDWLKENRPELSPAQKSHLDKSNRSLNVALRLARPFGINDSLWEMAYPKQVRTLAYEIARLKPFINFFI